MLKEVTGRASTYFFPFYYLKWVVFKLMLTKAVKNSEKIITVSEYVKKEIISTFNIPEDKIIVIYNGVPEKIQKKSLTEVNDVLQKFSISKPYLFYVGNAYPHKNLERLILAFTLFNVGNKYQLILGGKEDFFYKRLKLENQNLTKLKFIGELTDEEISALYSGCQAFVYPSISEGFGIQIIEALKCEARIICSKNTSFPEIAADYAFYFDPYSVEDIKRSLSENINSSYKDKLEKSLLRLEKFSWKLSAQQHHELFKKN
jgi:glycosyltransferase involved in cell wall biosynthesis